jgi:SulP family sulfate permease
MKDIFKPKTFTVYKQGYSKQQFIKDLFAGVIVGIVALPLAIAFAVASGVSPEKGLITAIIAGFIISFLGGSRVQIGGPTGAFIVIVYGVLSQYGIDGLIISTILAGIFLVIFGLLHLGSMLKFIPHPLVVGFTSGIAVVIFSTQIKDALGLTMESVPSDFISKWTAYFYAISTTNWIALAITLGTIIVSRLVNRFTNKIPGAFVAILLSTALVAVFKLPVTTIETLFGNIPSSVSFTIPHIDIMQVSSYFKPALTIALLCAIESLLSAVVSDGMISSNHRSNTELIAQGIANIVTPFFGGIPATGAIARTATNVKNGGRTPVAGMIHAVVLLLIMLFFGQWAKLIPMSCLAGILIVVSYNMSEWRSFLSIFKGSAFDIIILVITFLLTVLVDLTLAIEIGIVLAAVLFMKRMADNGQAILRDSNEDMNENYSHIPKTIEIYEISGPFFFGAAKEYSEVIKNTKSTTQILIIRMRHVPFIDATGIHNFREAIKSLKTHEKQIVLSGVQENVLNELQKSGISQLIGEDHIFDHFDKALKYAQERV